MSITPPEPATRTALPFRASPVAEVVADRIVALVDTGRAYEAEVLALWMAPQPVGEQTHG